MTTTTQRTNSAVATLVIGGRFDMHQVTPVQQEFDALLSAGSHFIILDLTAVNFVDSSALAVLVREMKRCRERNGELLLCGLRQPVRIIFELTGLDRAFRIFHDEASAQSALAGE